MDNKMNTTNLYNFKKTINYINRNNYNMQNIGL